MDKKGQIIDDEPANILQAQYNDMWSVPNPDDKIEDLEDFLKEDSTSTDLQISNVIFTRDKIRKAIIKMRIDAACVLDIITLVL